VVGLEGGEPEPTPDQRHGRLAGTRSDLEGRVTRAQLSELHQLVEEFFWVTGSMTVIEIRHLPKDEPLGPLR
jgi:hypothetical protein